MALDAATLERIAQHFGQPPWRRATPLTGGWSNESYAVGEGDARWVLTICPSASRSSLESLLAVNRVLEDAAFPTSRYHPASGTLEHEGQPVTLRSFIAGEVPDRIDADGVAQIGDALATLHGLTPPASVPEQLGHGHQAFAQLRGHEHPFVPWLERRAGALLDALPADLPRGLVHGDVFPDNTVFRGGRLAAILDFEDACVHPLAFDLGMAILGTCRPSHGDIDPQRVRALLRGYERRRSLSDSERRSVPLFSEYAALCIAFWRFRQFCVLTPWPQRAERYREMQDLVDRIHESSVPLDSAWFG